MGYSYLGEINNQSICIKYSSIPQTGSSTAQANLPSSISNHNMNAFNTHYNNNSTAPPVPPRPVSYSNMNSNTSNDILSIEQTFVHVNNLPHSVHSMSPTNQGYNPLQGVPFEINPIYSTNDNANKNRDNFSVKNKAFFKLD